MKPFPIHSRDALFPLLLSVFCLSAGACQRPMPEGTSAPRPLPPEPAPVQSGVKPVPPLDLPQPAPPDPTFDGQDLRRLDAHALLRRTRRLGRSGQDRCREVRPGLLVPDIAPLRGVDNLDVQEAVARLVS